MTTYTLTGDLGNLVGETLTSPTGAPAKAWLIPYAGATAESGEVRIGSVQTTLDAADTLSVADIPEGGYAVECRYYDPARRAIVTWSSGFFLLDADTDLADIVAAASAAFVPTRPAIDHGNTTGPLTLTSTYSLHEVTLTGAAAFTLNGPIGSDMLIAVTQDSAGGWALTVNGTATPINTGGGYVTYLQADNFATASWTIFVIDAPTPTPAGDTTPPTAPATVTVGTVTTNTMPITWGAGTDDIAVDHYEVTVDNGASLNRVLAGTPYTRDWTFYGLTPATSYTAKVRSVDPSGNVSAWTSATATSTSAGPVDNPPTAPTALSATPSFTTIALTWTASTDDTAVIAYRVSVNGGVTWVTSSVSGTSYTVTGLSPTTVYAVRVQAGDAAGQWSTSASVSATTLTPVADDSIIRLNLDEGTGTTSANLGGTPSATVNSAKWLAPGHTGATAVDFNNDATGAWRVDMTAAPVDVNAGDGWAMMIWVGTHGYSPGLLTRGTVTASAQVINLFQVETTGTGGSWTGIKTTLRLVGSGTENWTDALPAAQAMQVAGWHHVALKWTKATKEVKVFYDGALLATHTGSDDINGTLDYVFGSGSSPHEGPTDEYRFFDRAVSDSDIIALRNQVPA